MVRSKGQQIGPFRRNECCWLAKPVTCRDLDAGQDRLITGLRMLQNSLRDLEYHTATVYTTDAAVEDAVKLDIPHAAHLQPRPLTRFDHLTVEDLPENVRAYKTSRFMMDAEDPQELLTISELEKRYIHRVLSMIDSNKSRAARIGPEE